MTETTPERYTWIFTPAPDPRDAEIADLQRWVDIKQTTADGLSKLASAYKQDAEQATARIAQLEAALDRIVLLCVESRKAGPYQLRGYMATIERLADGALMPSPEGDMAVTVEELDA